MNAQERNRLCCARPASHRPHVAGYLEGGGWFRVDGFIAAAT